MKDPLDGHLDRIKWQTIEFHLGAILKQIETAVSKGAVRLENVELNNTQLDLLKKAGYGFSERARSYQYKNTLYTVWGDITWT